MSRARAELAARRGRRGGDRRAFCATVAPAALALALALLPGCGDDGGTPPGFDLPGMDASSTIDAGRDAAGEDATVVPPPPPPRDAGGGDARVMTDARPDDPDEDASVPECDDLDCDQLSDACNVGVCDPETVTCRLEPRPDGTACGSDTLDNCTAPDTCDQGECVANHAASGTACGDQDVDCHNDDACDGDGTCVDNGLSVPGSACGDANNDDCDDPDTCDEQGVCQPNYAPIDSLCGDVGVLCRYDDRCDGQGECVDNGAWLIDQCPMGLVGEHGQDYCLCGSSARNECHPGADVCIDGTCRLGHQQFAPNGVTTDGTPCGNGVPTDAQCDNPDQCQDGVCDENGEPPGTPCGDQATDTTCNRPDTCNGFGSCDQGWAPASTICGALPGECWLEPRCTGTGACAAAAPAPPSTACGDDDETVCDLADSCDGAGGCDTNYASSATACGDTLDDVCTHPDSCDGAGSCDPNHEPAGTLCGDTGQTCIADDTCNAGGVCVDGAVTSPCTVHGLVLADGVGAPGVPVAVVGGDSATTDANGEYDLDVPVQAQFLLQVGDSPGYWGLVRVRRFEPAQLANGLLTHLDADAEVEAIAQEVTPTLAVDRARGLVQVEFVGDAAGGGEGVTLSASSASPILFVPPDMFVYGTENNSQEAFMTVYNVQPGTTTVTPVDGDSNDCSLTYTPPSGWPVVAHTVTVVPVECE